MQTEQEQRAETVIAGFGGDLIEHGSIIAGALHDAGLLAAPVDGELREALARKLCPPSHRIGSGSITWPPGGIARREISEHRPCPLHQSEADALLPIIAAHLAEEKRKAAEKAWDEGNYWETGTPNPYRLGGE